jgi:phosphoribosylglycinamide formyltransferase 1
MNKKRIAIFASGNGSNAEEIIRYFKNDPDIEVAAILTNNSNAFVIERAKQHNLPFLIFNKTDFTQRTVVLDWLHEKRITHIVLAGFLWLIPAYLIEAFKGRMINIHPALLPSFGGKGMFGMKVHEAVKNSGAKETGITIHLVNQHYDEGEILFQGKCEIKDFFTTEDISNAVHELEYQHYPVVIEQWIKSSES